MSYLGRLNSLLTSTTSRYDSLRRNILSSSSEDDTNLTSPSTSHVSRVLRAYYTEKARPFPPWLGPDPSSIPSQQQQQRQPVASTRPINSLRSNASEANSIGSNRGAGGLGDLWGDGPATPAAVDEPRSLRRGVGAAGRRPGQGAGAVQSERDTRLNVRPLPSQRAGSYQTQQPQQGYQQQRRGESPVPPGSSGSGSGGGGGGAAERLKARLNRGGSGRSVNMAEGGVGGGGGSGYDGGGGGGEGRNGSGASGAGGGGGRYGDIPGGRYGDARDDSRSGSTGGGNSSGSYATQGLSGWQGRR